jgi:hypothetical protein
MRAILSSVPDPSLRSGVRAVSRFCRWCGAALLLGLIACEGVLGLGSPGSSNAQTSVDAACGEMTDASVFPASADAAPDEAPDPGDAPDASPDILPNGLPAPVGYWPLDLQDFIAPHQMLARVGGFDGVISGGTNLAAVGQIGGAFYFDDGDIPRDVVIIPPRAVDPLELTTAGTISVWAKFNVTPSVAGHSMTLVDKGGFATDESLLAFIVDDDASDNRFQFSIAAGRQGPFYVRPSLSIQAQVWYHVVATFRALGQMCVYVNGGSADVTCSPLPTSRTPDVQPLKFAEGSYFTSSAFNGYLDEIAIWATDLSASQVQALYDLGRAGTPLVPR